MAAASAPVDLRALAAAATLLPPRTRRVFTSVPPWHFPAAQCERSAGKADCLWLVNALDPWLICPPERKSFLSFVVAICANKGETGKLRKCLEIFCNFLQPQEYLPPIKEVQQPEGKRYRHQGQQQIAQTIPTGVEKILDITADQPRRDPREADDETMEKVDGDGVHAHPDEWLAPPLKFHDVHNPIKDAQSNRTVSAGNKHVRRCPNLFDDGKFQAP